MAAAIRERLLAGAAPAAGVTEEVVEGPREPPSTSKTAEGRGFVLLAKVPFRGTP